jgi:hypothetical protein
MAEFSATDAAIEGFRLAGRKPGAIAVWSLAQFLFAVLAGAILVVLVGADMQAMGQPADPANLEDPAKAMAALGGMLRATGLLMVLYVPWGAVMACAVYRAVLRPAEGGVGYLRFGPDEFRMMGLTVLLVGFSTAVLFALLIVEVILSLVVGALLGASGHSTQAGSIDPLAFVVSMIVGLAPMVAFFWVLVRISLAGPMTFIDKRLRLLGSWRLTSGRFWALAGTYALSLILLFVVMMIGLPLAVLIGHLITGEGMAPLLQSVGRPDYTSLQTWFTGPHLVMLALVSAYGGLSTAIFTAPAAAAYRMLAEPAEPATASEPARQPSGPWG